MTKKKHKKMNYDEVKLIIQNLYCEQSMDGQVVTTVSHRKRESNLIPRFFLIHF